MVSQFKRRALQVACMVGVVFGVCGCVAQDQTACAPATMSPQRDPRMLMPSSFSMGAGDAMGQRIFAQSAQQAQFATINDGAQ